MTVSGAFHSGWAQSWLFSASGCDVCKSRKLWPTRNTNLMRVLGNSPSSPLFSLTYFPHASQFFCINLIPVTSTPLQPVELVTTFLPVSWFCFPQTPVTLWKEPFMEEEGHGEALLGIRGEESVWTVSHMAILAPSPVMQSNYFINTSTNKMGFCWGARKTEEEKKMIFKTRTSEETNSCAHIFPCIQNTKDTKVHVENLLPFLFPSRGNQRLSISSAFFQRHVMHTRMNVRSLCHLFLPLGSILHMLVCPLLFSPISWTWRWLTGKISH